MKKRIKLVVLILLTVSTAGMFLMTMHVKGVVPNLIVGLTIALNLLALGIMFYHLPKIATAPQTTDEDELYQEEELRQMFAKVSKDGHITQETLQCLQNLQQRKREEACKALL